MSGMLSDEELAALMPSELLAQHTPIPTQIVASDEYYPDPQNEKQREVEARLNAMADDLGGRQGHRPPPLLPDGGRHGGVVRCHERGLWAAVRGEQGGSRHPGAWRRSGRAR